MTRVRRDPRAERAERLVPGGARLRYALGAIAVAPPAGRPRRDPRAALAAAAIGPSGRPRIDPRAEGFSQARNLASGSASQPGTGPGASGGGSARPEAARGHTTRPPVAPRTIDAPACLVLAVLDTPRGGLSPHDRQVLGAARRLAEAKDGAAVAVVSAPIAGLGEAGADRAAVLAPPAAAPELAAAIAALSPAHVLFAESPDGRDLARRVAALLAEPLATEVESLGPDLVIRPARSRRTEQRLAPPRLMTIAPDRVAPHAGQPGEARPLDLGTDDLDQRAAGWAPLPRGEGSAGDDQGRSQAGEGEHPISQKADPPHPIPLPAEERECSLRSDPPNEHRDGPTTGRGEARATSGERAPQSAGSHLRNDPYASRSGGEGGPSQGRGPGEGESPILSSTLIPADPAKVALTDAAFVVAAGNGVTDLDGFRALVRALGATPGASRVLVDRGLMPRQAQVGASGSVLTAEVYLALGIAGAPQHLQGIASVEHVIAVNSDLHAAIVKRAALAIVADAQGVMPALLARLGHGNATYGQAGAPRWTEPEDASEGIAGGRIGAEGNEVRSRSGPSALALLSEGVHPVSGRPRPAHADVAAIAMGLGAGLDVAGLHAGEASEVARDYGGHGLGRLLVARCVSEADPVPALVAAIAAASPAVVLAGAAGEAGDGTGLVPYRVALALGWPIVADAVALVVERATGIATINQALPRGARRRVRVRLPAVVTVGPSAPRGRPFALGQRRRLVVEIAGGSAGVETARPGFVHPLPRLAAEERPYRPRPRIAAAPPAGRDAATRLAALTTVSGGRGRLFVHPSAEDAADAILADLRRLGVLG